MPPEKVKVEGGGEGGVGLERGPYLVTESPYPVTAVLESPYPCRLRRFEGGEEAPHFVEGPGLGLERISS